MANQQIVSGKMINKRGSKERLRLYNQGLTDRGISDGLKKIGCSLSISGVSCWRHKNNLISNYNQNIKTLSKEEHNERLKLYNQGLSDIDIAKKLNLTRGKINYWRRMNNLETKNKQYFDKCVIPDYIFIEAINTGKSAQVVADVFGVSDTYVRRIARKNNIKAWIYGKSCSYCGDIFTSNIRHQKRCKECSAIKRDTYGDVKAMRKDFFNLLRKNPEEAMKLKAEMKDEEGFAFMDFALNGICPEKVYEAYGYTILKENGGVLFEEYHNIKGKNGKHLTKDEMKYLKESYFDKLYTVYQFVCGTKYGNDFIIYYINPFECIKKLIKRKSGAYSREKIIDMCQKVLKQHKDYVLNEVDNEDGEYYKWNEKFTWNREIFEEFTERLNNECG